MSRFPRLERLCLRLAIVAAGGSIFALDGCDPTVKSTILTGLETASTGLADTFIQAFFLKLATDDTTGTGTTTTTTTTGSSALLQTAHDLMAQMLA